MINSKRVLSLVLLSSLLTRTTFKTLNEFDGNKEQTRLAKQRGLIPEWADREWIENNLDSTIVNLDMKNI